MRKSKLNYREQVLVKQAIADLSKQFPTKDVTDIDNLINSLKHGMKDIHSYLNLIDMEVKSKGQDHSRSMLTTEVQNRILPFLSRYSKDELLLLFTCILADGLVREYI